MSRAHDGHVACVHAGPTTLCAQLHAGRLVIHTGPGTTGWWPTTPNDLTAAADTLQALADTWAARLTRAAQEDHPTLFDGPTP